MPENERERTVRLGASADTFRDGDPIPQFLLDWQRYTITRRLGSGGMGTVFEAWDPRLGRLVALKFLSGGDREMLQRFQHEARAQARVDHPAICKVFEVGDVAGHHYIAMQEIRGQTLDRAASSLSLEQKVTLVRTLAEAIHSAHRIGLIHRDLKPGNILVEQDEDGAYRPYIVDFGLARDQQSPGATISGTVYGTVGYMSPEQARGRFEEIDRRTDVYNLGLILYELTAGRPAFEYDTVVNTLVRLQTIDLDSPRRFNQSIPRDLETIIMKAVEREPARRYDSAHAMAEDLRRFLDGEPIVARRSSVLYRLSTRLRKHRAAAAAIGVALVLLAIAGGSALRERWRADARAELAQRFGMQAKEMEMLSRVARMLPPEHAIPPRALVVPRMERIRVQMRASGSIAEGPGSYALARGSIALGDYRGAWNDLERARRARYDTPEVHYARGQVLGHFYEEALTRSANISETELRKAALNDAARQFRAPAIEELRLASKATVDSPELLRAQLALQEERFDDAIASARRAAASSPWMYEAVLTEVAALRTQAHAQSNSGKAEAALAQYSVAMERLKNALAIARSDARVYYEQCELQNEYLHSIRFQRRLIAEDGEPASAACGVAAKLDPFLSAPWSVRAAIFTVIGEDLVRNGADPSAVLSEAIAASRRAIVIDANDAVALASAGRAQLIQARWGLFRGVDPRPLLDAAEVALRKAMAADPRESAYHLTLANAYVTRGEYEQRSGGDSRPWLLKAIAEARRALQVNPNLFLLQNVLGNTYNSLADREAARGGDPRAALSEASKAFERAIAIAPSNHAVLNNNGNTWLGLAEYQAGRGEPLDDAASKALASYRRAIELRPDYMLAWFNVGSVNRLLALDRVRHVKDPSVALRDADDAFRRYEATTAGDVDAFVERARLGNIRARWMMSRGEDPRPALADAERAARAALSLEPKAVAAMIALGERERWEAEWLSSKKQRTTAPVQRGLEIVARAKAADPQSADALALEGTLLLIDARDRYPESADALRKRAAPLIEQALRMKPSLAPDYKQ